MKIKISKQQIIEVLQKVQSIVSPRSTLPILSNILLRAEDKKLWLTATDLEVSVETSVEAEVEREGATTMPARRVFSIFKELAAQDIEIDVDEKHVASVTAGSSSFKLNGISDEEFPPMPKFQGETTYVIDQPVFREMLEKVSYAASTDETRYVLNGALLSFKDEKLTVVATDGRRLALVEQEVEFPKQSEADLILPTKTIQELIRTLGHEGEMSIKATENQISFEFGDMQIVSKLIDGTYPNFRQVIPAQCEERVTIERETLLSAVRLVSLLTTDQSNSVKMNFRKNKLEIATSSPDVGEAHENVPIKYTGKDVSVAFNPEFVMDPLKALDCDEIYFEMTDDLSPGVVKCDVPFIYVIMPMRVT